jgi:glycosyltransferase involved in cell wall biosynthesis
MPRNFPHLMLVHDIIFAVFPEHTDTLRKKLSAWLTIRGLRRATHRVAVSAYTKNDLVRRLGLAAGSISVAHIAAAPELAIPASMERVEEVLKKYGLASGYIYHGGGFDQRKNARAVIEAFRLLVYSLDQPPAMPPLRLVLTGAPTPHVDELMQLVREWNLSQYVVLLGCVPQADLAPLYRGAALFVYPSRYEGFGLPLLEAMHQGVPVVASNVTSLPEVGGDAAIYCDPDRPADLAAAMHTILTDAAARSRLRQEGPPRAAMFTWDLFAAQFMECAMKLLPKA